MRLIMLHILRPRVLKLVLDVLVDRVHLMRNMVAVEHITESALLRDHPLITNVWIHQLLVWIWLPIYITRLIRTHILLVVSTRYFVIFTARCSLGCHVNGHVFYSYVD